ncbi:tripartite tricarboxylate transporter TctB family protein [Candidatus Atribacteria bacterium 1244-E10-H5-B2]|nr:hypothetical protein [Clostridia bacterium]RXG62930.1 MAG: tripartite tricarboxylate transporter TctB family protein [Candidatus Atribacteria bacterium 1244-E10-H5-B2]
MKKDDILSGCILIAISIYFLRESNSLPPSSLGIPGSAFFPRLVCFAFVIFGGIFIIRSFKKGEAERKITLILKQDLIRVLAVILLCGIYIFSIPFLGFILTSILFIVFLMFIFQVKRIGIIILWGFLVTLIIYFIFKILLKVPLPAGMFFS